MTRGAFGGAGAFRAPASIAGITIALGAAHYLPPEAAQPVDELSLRGAISIDPLPDGRADRR